MACTLSVIILRVDAPTAAGGWGQVTYRIAGTVDTSQTLDVFRLSDGVLVQGASPYGDGDYTIAIPSSHPNLGNGIGVPLILKVYEDAAHDATTCQAQAEFLVPAFVPLVDPSLNDPARWEPVGGVLPNPILLKVEAALTNAAGATRAGLHVEVELWRPAALAAFASFRATVREATQYVDAAPYLRAELVALQRYAATASAPLVDQQASLRFYYRYRVVDKDGPEQWLTRAGQRYAVLAALPGPADTMSPYVADTTGRVASVFPDFEGVQFVGRPLEASVLLPPDTGAPRWAELCYLDAYKQPVEIRSYALASTLPAGMLRIPLPNDPPLCAAYVEVSVRDDDRHYAGTCGHVVPVPPTSTAGLYSDNLYGFY